MSSVTNNISANRYELVTDGHVSVADYQLRGSELVITHVGVPSELRGRGIAAQLMEGVAADAKAKSLTIVPVCSYAAAWMKRQAGH